MTGDMQLDSGAFPAMQDVSGFDPGAAALQMGLLRMSGQTPSAPFAAARDFARAIAQAEMGSDSELDVMRMPM